MKNIRQFFTIIIFIYINSTFSFAQFVTMEGNGFKLNGNKFYPVAVNYHVEAVYNPSDPNVFFASPYHEYGPNGGPNAPPYDFTTASACSTQMATDFQRIAAMGFNSIRIVGSYAFDYGNGPGVARFYAHDVTSWTASKLVEMTYPYTETFGIIQTILDAAATAGLKVQLLIGGSNRIGNAAFSNSEFVPYLQALAAHFSNNSTLYSYDLVNEPSFALNDPVDKSDVCTLVESWHNAIHNNSNHLTTIGLWASPDPNIFLWDPGFLKLDFLSYHIYPIVKSDGMNSFSNALGRVNSAIKWCSEVSTLPWMIGEISFAASTTIPNINYPDDGTETQQKVFAQETLEAVRDCGGIGYSWWQYQDSPSFDSNRGLVDGNFNDKLVVSEFSPTNFNPNILGSSCSTINYNYYNYTIYNVTGIVKDQNNLPIKNAVISGWDINGQSYENHVQTFSKADGTFSLFSNSPIDIIKTTAIGASSHSDYVYPTISSPYYMGQIALTQFQPAYDVIINNVTIANQTINYEATHNIMVSNTNINSGGASTMKAENEIQITSAFGVSSNCSFQAYIANVHADCGSFSYRTANDTITSVADRETFTPDQQAISVYPNPVNEILYIKYNNDLFKNSQIEIYDITGRLVLQEEDASSISTENFKAGMYLVKIKRDPYEKTFKINIQH